MAQPPAFPALQTQQQPFLCVETLKVVVGRAEAALARENHFRLFDAMPSDALKALTTESMRRANYGGGSHEVMVQAAVDGVCDRVRTAHHLVRGSVQADFDRISAERAGIPAAPPPPPPIEEDDDVPSEAELKAEKAVFAASLQGLPKDERKRKKAEFKAQCKQKQAEFKRSAAQDRERSSHDVQAKWDFLREVQANETRQLAEKQRSELEHFQP